MATIWLGSAPSRLLIGGRRVALNSHHAGDVPVEATSGNMIMGLAEIELSQVYTDLCMLKPLVRQHYNIWRSVVSGDLNGKLLLVKVVHKFALPACAPVQQCSRKRSTGPLFVLEEGQPARLWEMVPHELRWIDEVPVFGLRLPAFVAWSIVAGLTDEFLLPYLGPRWPTLHFAWSKLGLSPEDLPLPRIMGEKSLQVLDGAFALHVADFLRQAAAGSELTEDQERMFLGA